jgi:hypothetical protein
MLQVKNASMLDKTEASAVTGSQCLIEHEQGRGHRAAGGAREGRTSRPRPVRRAREEPPGPVPSGARGKNLQAPSRQTREGRTSTLVYQRSCSTKLLTIA